MTKVVSDRQRRANQANACKSTGPKTVAGRARASRNALKHGFLARDVVIAGTDLAEVRAEFNAFLADLYAELQPGGLIEETLVERIATCYWRLRRVQRFEVGAIRGTLDATDPDAQQLERLRAKLAHAERALATECRLAALIDKPHNERTPPERQELARTLRDFSNTYGLPVLDCPSDTATPAPNHAPDGKRTPMTQPTSSLTTLTPNNDAPSLEDHVRQVLPNMIHTLQTRVDSLRVHCRTAETDEALRQARRPYIAALPDRDALLRVVRYENMLDRQIHRALAELRKRQKMQPPTQPEDISTAPVSTAPDSCDQGGSTNKRPAPTTGRTTKSAPRTRVAKQPPHADLPDDTRKKKGRNEPICR